MVRCNSSNLSSVDSSNQSSCHEDHEDRHILSTHPALNGIQFGLGLAVLLINVSFLCLLYRRRKRLQWKRYAFVANTAVADSFGGVALMVIVVANFVLASSTDHRRQTAVQLIALYTVLAASLSVTVESYDVLILVQYLAIRHPLWYKILVTKRKIFLFFWWVWIVNPGYATFKTCVLIHNQDKYYKAIMYFELCFLGGTCLWNTCTYFYVLSVAARKKSQLNATARVKGAGPARSSYSADGSGDPSTAPVTPAGSNDIGSIENDSSVSTAVGCSLPSPTLPRQACNDRAPPRVGQSPRGSTTHEFLKQYRFVATAGLNLMAYWISLVPLISAYVYMLFRGERMYFNEGTVRHVTILLWFFRSLCDPLIYMAREEKLRRATTNRKDMIHIAWTTSGQHEAQPRVSLKSSSVSIQNQNASVLTVRQ